MVNPLLNEWQASDAEACAGSGLDVDRAEWVNGQDSDSLQFAVYGHLDFLADSRFLHFLFSNNGPLSRAVWIKYRLQYRR